METKKKVEAKYYVKGKYYVPIKVYEDELAGLEAANRETWREEYYEKQRIKERIKSGYTFESLDAFDELGDEIEDKDIILPDDALIYQEEGTPEENFEKEHTERLKLLKEVLELLTEKQKEVINAVFWEGKTLHQYSEEIGKADNTVRENFELGINKIKKYFKKNGKEIPENIAIDISVFEKKDDEKEEK